MSEQNAPTPNQRSDASELRRLGRQAIFQVSSNEYWRVVIERAAEELERLQASSEAGAGADDEWEFQIRRALDQLMLRARANPHAGIIELREFCNLELNAVASHVRAAASPASEQEADTARLNWLGAESDWGRIAALNRAIASGPVNGVTLREAIDAAMAAGTLPSEHGTADE